jgi:hypothetical protein
MFVCSSPTANSNPQCGDRAFGRELSHEDASLMTGISAFISRAIRDYLSLHRVRIK